MDINPSQKSLSNLAMMYDNGKIGGEAFEYFLIANLKRNNHQAEKVEGRKKEDIIVDGKKYSVKSSTTDELQIDTMSDAGITLSDLVQLSTEKNYKKEIENKNEIIQKILNKLNTMPIFCNFTKLENNKASFMFFELTFNQIANMLSGVDKIIYSRPNTRNKLDFIKNDKVLFTLKDGTGQKAANAFQRGLWSYKETFSEIDKLIKNDIVYNKLEELF